MPGPANGPTGLPADQNGALAAGRNCLMSMINTHWLDFYHLPLQMCATSRLCLYLVQLAHFHEERQLASYWPSHETKARQPTAGAAGKGGEWQCTSDFTGLPLKQLAETVLVA